MHQYTIEITDKTKQISKNSIALLKSLRVNLLNRNIISQLLRSVTSIGANYQEAVESESKDDFVHKLSICKKEAKETLYWLDLLKTSNPEVANNLAPIENETTQLIKIFASSIATIKRNKSQTV